MLDEKSLETLTKSQSNYPTTDSTLSGQSWPGRTLIFGGSRGLGRAIGEMIANHGTTSEVGLSSQELLIVSRNPQVKLGTALPWDLADEKKLNELIPQLCTWNPQTIFYAAGGGPWGNFQNQSWDSHTWALQLNLLTPMRILHDLLRTSSSLRQWIFIGSAIAEDKADPRASSYCAAKHALRGLVGTLQSEKPVNASGQLVDIRLFSPGYMDTDLIPSKFKKALVEKGILLDPQTVAADLVEWAQRPNPSSGHRICTP